MWEGLARHWRSSCASSAALSKSTQRPAFWLSNGTPPAQPPALRVLSPPDISAPVYLLLFGVGLSAGTVDAIAGGGGLIALPALLAAGLPGPLALGTSKLQGTFGTVSSTWHFARQGAVNLRECLLGLICTGVGAVGGALAVQHIDSHLLERLIPWLLATIVVYLIFRPQLGETDRRHRLGSAVFYVVFGLGLGFYDGFFGPGVGSFWTIAFVMLLGHNFVKAAGHAKAMNLASNLAALIFFLVAGTVMAGPGLVMGAGQLIGGRIGAHLALTRGARFVRPIFLTMVGLVALKLVYVAATRP